MLHALLQHPASSSEIEGSGGGFRTPDCATEKHTDERGSDEDTGSRDHRRRESRRNCSKRATALIACFAASGCAGTFGASAPCSKVCHANRIGRGAAVLALAADAASTLAAARRDWTREGPDGQVLAVEEGGMPTRAILGPRPSTGAVAAYFLVGGIVLLGLAELLPERVRPFAYGVVIAVEGATTIGNIEYTGPAGIAGGHVRP